MAYSLSLGQVGFAALQGFFRLLALRHVKDRAKKMQRSGFPDDRVAQAAMVPYRSIRTNESIVHFKITSLPNCLFKRLLHTWEILVMNHSLSILRRRRKTRRIHTEHAEVFQ